MRRKDPAMVAKLQQAIDEGGDRRPPLYQWMVSHYDELVSMFDGTLLNWDRITASFREMGFTNGSGGDLRPETVRQTWYKVRKRKEARKTTRQYAPIEVLSHLVPVPSSPPTPSPTTPTNPPTSVNDAMADVLAEMNRRSGRI